MKWNEQEVIVLSYREFAYYYDRLMEDMPYSNWFNFARQSWARLEKPDTVVDLGCGTGSITIPLAEQGFKVTGIDLSEDMLAVARQKEEKLKHLDQRDLKIQYDSTGNRGAPINWLHQDMTEWELPYKVDAVISFCDCLNYLLEEEQIRQTFQRVYEGLHTGGSFIFDVHTPLQLEEYAAAQPFTWNEADLAYIWSCSLDFQRCEIEHELTIFAKYIPRPDMDPNLFHRIDEVHTQRAYSLEWLRVSLEETGFHEVKCYADFTMEPVTKQTKRAFFVAVK